MLSGNMMLFYNMVQYLIIYTVSYIYNLKIYIIISFSDTVRQLLYDFSIMSSYNKLYIFIREHVLIFYFFHETSYTSTQKDFLKILAM
jgi:hypothetical protein